ncbi:ser/Thr protein phosphatase family protein [Xylariaceae sp. FL0594]|nr:ser/Thr protein phosphatase family protein [Xylariaceae sp. FL0594]
MSVKTRFFIISDTHGKALDLKEGLQADVAIHCGNLTDKSTIDEFCTTLHLLRRIPAPLKLVIAGNHDLTLDEPAFEKAADYLDPLLVNQVYGPVGQSRRLLERAIVYASPFTPSQGGWAYNGGWAYGYPRGEKHDFAIGKDVDVVITHGPPHGIMDYTHGRERAGCHHLFGAVARARPMLHCFGHIHEGWGSRLVTWRDKISEHPWHFEDIDHTRSVLIDKLSNLIPTQFDEPDMVEEKARRRSECAQRGYCSTSHCSTDASPLRPNKQTLFINASIEGSNDVLKSQPPFLIDIELPATNRHTATG